MKSALVVFSGGQDSTTCLLWAKHRFDYVETLTFDYGQKHDIEILQAKEIAKILEVKNSVFKLNIFKELNDSALINDELDVNSSHRLNANLPASFVPNRNATFFTIAHSYALKKGLKNIITGVNQADYSGYPDCREDFIKSLENALNLGSEANIKFHYPLINLTKAQTFALAKEENGLDIVINKSHTCYNGVHDTLHPWGYGCGTCAACKLRKNGFEEFLRF